MHYIILTHSISGIGGSMQYVYNKYHYLVEHGFDCIIVSVMLQEIRLLTILQN